MQNPKKLNILVFSENLQSLRQVMTWFSLVGHYTRSCNDSHVFLDELTKSEIEYELAFVDAAKHNLMAILENIQLSHVLNIYDISKKKTKFILYGGTKFSSVCKQAINDAQTSYLTRTTNQIEFFEALSNVLELPSGTGNYWNAELDAKLSSGAHNVVQLRPQSTS